MVAGSSVPSMALSTMQPATALPLPLPTHPGPRGGESSRHSRSPALSSPGGGPRKLAPLWNLTADPPDQAGWSNLSIRTLPFPGHPQEATENSIGLGHIRYVREYSGVNRIEPMSVDGPYLQSRSDFKSIRRTARTVPFNLDIYASTPSSSLCC